MISSAFLLALGAASAVSAIPLSPMKYDTLAALEKRIVISPEIQTPNADTVWTAGQEATASWETDLLEEYPEAGDSGRLVLGQFYLWPV